MCVCVAAMMTLVPGMPVCDFNHLSCFGDDPLRHRNQVAHHDRGTRLAVIKHGGLGENIVEHTFAAAFVIVTGQGNAKRRIDRNGGGA